MSDSASSTIHVEGDNTIVVTAGDNSTVNITRPAEIYDDAEIKIRLDNLEAANTVLLQIVQENLPHIYELFKKNNLGRLERVGPGSVYIFVQVSQRKELENLWKLYENGELKDEITKILLSGTSHRATGNIQVYIDREEYLRVKEAFEQEDLMRLVLQQSTKLLCDNLKAEDILPSLKTEGALTPEDVQGIRRKETKSDKVKALLDILSRRSVSHYVKFMVSLNSVREDLHKRIKAVEEKHNFYPAGPDSKTMGTKQEEQLRVIQLSNITIKKSLKRGGYGKVSKAVHKNWGEVAIKEFLEGILAEDIRKEATKMWRVIPCPYLVRILGFIDEGENPMIVMEYFEHGSLKDFNRKYMMGCDCWARKMKMIVDISLGMNYLHTLQSPIFHGDLKLDNIFVDDRWKVKIGDFGSAVSITSKTTQDTKGTCTHIPPEGWTNLSAIQVDQFWDIFTFGITLFELLSGQDPYEKYSKQSLMTVGYKVAHMGERPNLEAIPDDAPKEVVDIMIKCWDAEKTKRPLFQVIQEIFSAIFEEKYQPHALMLKADLAIIRVMERELMLDEKGEVIQSGDSGYPVSQVSSIATSTASGGSFVKKKMKVLHQQLGAVQEHQSAPSTSSTNWQLTNRIESSDKPLYLSRVAVCSNGKVVVIDSYNDTAHIHDHGVYHQIISPSSEKFKLMMSSDVAVTKHNNILIADSSKFIKLFRADGKYLRSICTLTESENPDTKVDTTCVAASSQGHIFVGDTWTEKITIHHETDELYYKCIQPKILPVYLAVTGDTDIVLSDGGKVVSYNMESGREVFTIDSWKLDDVVEDVHPFGVACDNKHNIYIIVRTHDYNTGHVHVYNDRGEFLECIVKGLLFPRGLTWWNNSLYIADSLQGVKVYSKE